MVKLGANRKLSVWITLLFSLLFMPQLAADEFDRVDVELAKQLVSSGELLPLERIIASLTPHYRQGRIIDLELEKEHGIYIYELEFLFANGEVEEVEIDARTGQILEAD